MDNITLYKLELQNISSSKVLLLNEILELEEQLKLVNEKIYNLSLKEKKKRGDSFAKEKSNIETLEVLKSFYKNKLNYYMKIYSEDYNTCTGKTIPENILEKYVNDITNSYFNSDEFKRDLEDDEISFDRPELSAITYSVHTRSFSDFFDKYDLYGKKVNGEYILSKEKKKFVEKLIKKRAFEQDKINQKPQGFATDNINYNYDSQYSSGSESEEEPEVENESETESESESEEEPEVEEPKKQKEMSKEESEKIKRMTKKYNKLKVYNFDKLTLKELKDIAREPDINIPGSYKMKKETLVDGFKSLVKSLRIKLEGETKEDVKEREKTEKMVREFNERLEKRELEKSKSEKTRSDSDGSVKGELKIVNGNILNSKEKYIVQQCNCSGKKLQGLSKQIYEKFKVNPYNRSKDDEPGTYEIIENIVCLYAQLNPGKPSKNDTKSMRLKWFKESLEDFMKDKKGTIAIPYNIGCGLAGGNWDDYLSVITSLTNKYNKKVTIYKLPE